MNERQKREIKNEQNKITHTKHVSKQCNTSERKETGEAERHTHTERERGSVSELKHENETDALFSRIHYYQLTLTILLFGTNTHTTKRSLTHTAVQTQSINNTIGFLRTYTTTRSGCYTKLYLSLSMCISFLTEWYAAIFSSSYRNHHTCIWNYENQNGNVMIWW